MSILIAFILFVALTIVITLHVKTRKNYHEARQNLERFAPITDIEREVEQIRRVSEESTAALNKRLSQREQASESTLNQYQAKIRAAKQEYAQKTVHIKALSSKIIQQEEALDLEMCGFYRPRYDFLDVARFAQELKRIRAEIKTVIKNKNAILCATEWTVEGSKAKGRKMTDRIIKLGLSSLNTQVDNVILKVTVKNIGTSENRIRKSVQVVHKRRRPKVRLIPMRSWASTLRHPEKRFKPPTKPACMNTIQTRWLTWVRSCKRSLIVRR